MKKKIFILSLILAFCTYGETTGGGIEEEKRKNVVAKNTENVKLVIDEFQKLTKDLIYNDTEKLVITKSIEDKKMDEKVKEQIDLELKNRIKAMEEKAKKLFQQYLPNGIPKDLTKSTLQKLQKEVNEKIKGKESEELFFKAMFKEMSDLAEFNEKYTNLTFENIEGEYKNLSTYVCHELLTDFKKEIEDKYTKVKEFYEFSKKLIEDNVYGKEDRNKFIKEVADKKIAEEVAKNFEKTLGTLSDKAYEEAKTNIEKDKKLSEKEKEEKLKEINTKWEKENISVEPEVKEESKKINLIVIGIISGIVLVIITLVLVLIKKKQALRKKREEKPKQDMGKTNKIHNLDIGNESHQGKRKEQQDEYKWSNITNEKFVQHGGILAVVCDGMGGMKNGRDASTLASTVFVREYSAKKESEKVSDALYRALIRTNEAVYQETKKLGVEGASGTTLVATAIKDNKLNFISVGDSFIYLFRDKELSILNKQHIYRNKLVEEYTLGKRSFESIDTDPNVKGLTSYIGGAEIAEIDLLRLAFPLKGGDIIVLASDGLSDALNNDEIANILSMSGKSQELATNLVKTAIGKNRTYQDNTTVLVIKVGE